MLRSPRSPIAEKRKNRIASSGLAKMFGLGSSAPSLMAEFVVRVAGHWPRSRLKLRPGLGGAQVALLCRFQLVGHVRPLMALAGSPVLKRTTLETCQPPISWLTKPEVLAPQRRPRPNGSSHVRNPFT